MELQKVYPKDKFFADNPTLIGVVGTVRFYEHPKFGDEVPLVAYDTSRDTLGLSYFWEVPRFEEIYTAA